MRGELSSRENFQDEFILLLGLFRIFPCFLCAGASASVCSCLSLAVLVTYLCLYAFGDSNVAILSWCSLFYFHVFFIFTTI